MNKSLDQNENIFQPRGAIAFFGLVIAIIAAVWLMMYFLMIKQA